MLPKTSFKENQNEATATRKLWYPPASQEPLPQCYQSILEKQRKLLEGACLDTKSPVEKTEKTPELNEISQSLVIQRSVLNKQLQIRYNFSSEENSQLKSSLNEIQFEKSKLEQEFDFKERQSKFLNEQLRAKKNEENEKQKKIDDLNVQIIKAHSIVAQKSKELVLAEENTKAANEVNKQSLKISNLQDMLRSVHSKNIELRSKNSKINEKIDEANTNRRNLEKEISEIEFQIKDSSEQQKISQNEELKLEIEELRKQIEDIEKCNEKIIQCLSNKN